MGCEKCGQYENSGKSKAAAQTGGAHELPQKLTAVNK
jgi:hypothetical protein